MKLKTLKDLSRMQRNDNYRIVEEETLREEAIKWVKFQEDVLMHNPDYAIEYRLNIQWIKNFFNLTEEDLE